MKQIDIDLSKVSDWDSLHECLANTFGFPFYGTSNRDALNDHLADLLPGMYCLIPNLQKGERLILGLFGLGGLRRRNRLLAVQFDKLWIELNDYATRAEGYDSDFIVLKTVDKVRHTM